MEQFVIFKSTRLYPGGNGYQDYPPATREQAERDAAALGAKNPVGFTVLPYLTPEEGRAAAVVEEAKFRQELAELDEQLAAQRAAEPAWFAQLRGQGVAAAFPDDAWANQPGPTLTIFPENEVGQFIDQLHPGAVVALGSAAKYRLVMLGEPAPARPHMQDVDTTRFLYHPIPNLT